jgi:hypothetical protein
VDGIAFPKSWKYVFVPQKLFPKLPKSCPGKENAFQSLLLSSSTREEKKQCHLEKSSIAIYYQKPNKWFY